MPFRKIQSYISYKTMEHCFNPEMVDVKNTPKTCPIYGGLNKPKGHLFKCRRCVLQADRHLVAAWNIAMKRSMWGVLPLLPKALDEPLILEVRGRDEYLWFCRGFTELTEKWINGQMLKKAIDINRTRLPPYWFRCRLLSSI
ncbi:MAG: zinc ribbon domain-containing protein [Candidatus Caldarchaeum sp.]